MPARRTARWAAPGAAALVLSCGNTHSLSQVEQQIGSLTRSGSAAQAFKKLVTYVTSKCY
jgi:hypothetical protein